MLVVKKWLDMAWSTTTSFAGIFTLSITISFDSSTEVKDFLPLCGLCFFSSVLAFVDLLKANEETLRPLLELVRLLNSSLSKLEVSAF